jgi:hypothetical protein
MEKRKKDSDSTKSSRGGRYALERAATVVWWKGGFGVLVGYV